MCSKYLLNKTKLRRISSSFSIISIIYSSSVLFELIKFSFFCELIIIYDLQAIIIIDKNRNKHKMTNCTDINTERLFLRSLNINDAEALFNYRSDSTANKYQGWIPITINDSIDFIKNRISPTVDKINTWFQFAIIKKENNELIGDIGIHFFDPDKYQVEIGFTLDEAQQGNGYATEALRATINYLFYELNKRRIIASIDPRNTNSIKLVSRLGFRKEAHFRKSILINGEWVDDLIYALLIDEWNEKK